MDEMNRGQRPAERWAAGAPGWNEEALGYVAEGTPESPRNMGDPVDQFAQAETLPVPTPPAFAEAPALSRAATVGPAVQTPPRRRSPGGGGRRAVLSAINRWRQAPASSRRMRTLALSCALLVAVVAATTLGALAFGDGSFLAFSLFGSHAATPQATTPMLGVSGTKETTQHSGESPQGCVNGMAPLPGQGPYGPFFSLRGNAHVKDEVALTFDDGPNPVFTPQILSELETASVHATFFVVGKHAQQYPDLIRSEWQDGNAVGNHTFSHEWIPGLTPDKLRANLEQTSNVIRQATGDQCVWLFRAPYGDYMPGVGPTATPGTPSASGTPETTTPTPVPTRVQIPITVTRAWATVHGAGYTAFNWDVDGKDWLRPGTNLIEQRIIAQLHGGAIILMHDGAPDNERQDRTQTVAALPAILAAIKARGLRPVTLPQMLADAGLLKFPPAPTPTATPNTSGLQGGLPPSSAALALGPLLAQGWLRRRVRRSEARTCTK